MGSRRYKQEVEQSLKEHIRASVRGNDEQNIGDSKQNIGDSKREQNNTPYINLGNIRFPNDVINNIYLRFKDNKGEILFGYNFGDKLVYDFLEIGKTKSGYLPKKFITSNRVKLDLYSLIDVDLDDPYKPVFEPISKYFERKGSKINYNYLVDLYLGLKKKLINKADLKEEEVFFLEKRSDLYKMLRQV